MWRDVAVFELTEHAFDGIAAFVEGFAEDPAFRTLGAGVTGRVFHPTANGHF